MKTIILAGGFATRLWPLTEKTAKPLILLAGKPMISWIVDSLPEDMEIIVSTNAVFADDFDHWKKDFPKRNIEIFVEDSKSEKGKKGALYATSLVLQEKNIEDDILLIAGDNYFGFSLKNFITDFHAHPRSPLLAAYDIKDLQQASSFGVVVPKKNSSDEVENFQEKPKNPLSTFVSTGCFAFPKHLLSEIISFAEQNKDDLGKIFEHYLSLSEIVRFFSFQEEWFDVGSFAAYLEANMLLLKNKIHAESQVEGLDQARIHGSVFLGKNVKLFENVEIENSIILEGSTLKNCKIRNSVIGKNTFISDIDLERKIIRDESFLMR